MTEVPAPTYRDDVVYQPVFHDRQTPTHMASVAALYGCVPPSCNEPFVYTDLGCGQGHSLMMLASAYPQAQFYGVDFNAKHIEIGRTNAAAMGLDNLQFIQASFEDLPTAGADIPPCDFITMWGIFSWLTDAPRNHALGFVGRHLKPGGLFGVHYMALPGHYRQKPFIDLARSFYKGQTGDEATKLARTRQFLSEFLEANPALYASFPSGKAFVKNMLRGRDSLLLHDYLSDVRRSYSVQQVAHMLSQMDCTFVGHNNMQRVFPELTLPKKAVSSLEAASNGLMRDAMLDYATANDGRIDLYQKAGGPEPVADDQAQAPFDGLNFVALRNARFTNPVKFHDLMVKLDGTGDGSDRYALPYAPVAEALEGREPLSFADIRRVTGIKDPAVVRRIIGHLLAAGKIRPHKVPDPTHAPGDRLSKHALRLINFMINRGPLDVTVVHIPSVYAGWVIGLDWLYSAIAVALQPSQHSTEKMLASLMRSAMDRAKDQRQKDAIEAQKKAYIKDKKNHLVTAGNILSDFGFMKIDPARLKIQD